MRVWLYDLSELADAGGVPGVRERSGDGLVCAYRGADRRVWHLRMDQNQ